ncbi:protein MENT [Pipistrellus kuhlii]|uniref:Methylated in normal thymocytes n=1 Tax=Pipistrellus kuhlii TaxID=59472 RepID=A0A7J7TVK1_PIPKU|nr:protein MENT [Pipistrellus kuhlii]KAF6304623.1 methylated in normal thymocytes [Pipistrellus kuhlii]
MVPALLWALLLLSLGTEAVVAGAQGPTAAGRQPARLRSRGPPTRNYRPTPRTGGGPPKRRVIMEDEDDESATADRLAGPAVDELLASTVSTDMNRLRSWEQDQDGSLEEGVVINAQKNNSEAGLEGRPSTTTRRFSSRFAANIQEPEYRLATSLPPEDWNTEHRALYDTSLAGWSTAGSTPRRWSRVPLTSAPPPEELRLVLMPWGPWHCHCQSGTMSRTRAGRLQGLSGRLRVGALSQLRTEHRPCTYRQCRCDRRLEECPLDSALWPETQTTTTTTTPTTTTTTPAPAPILTATTTTTTSSRPMFSHSTRYSFSPGPSPSPALLFWRHVRAGLEDIWNSLSSVFIRMQPIDRNRRLMAT